MHILNLSGVHFRGSNLLPADIFARSRCGCCCCWIHKRCHSDPARPNSTVHLCNYTFTIDEYNTAYKRAELKGQIHVGKHFDLISLKSYSIYNVYKPGKLCIWRQLKVQLLNRELTVLLDEPESFLTRQPKPFQINLRKNVQILSGLVLLRKKWSRHYTELIWLKLKRCPCRLN